MPMKQSTLILGITLKVWGQTFIQRNTWNWK